MPRPARRFLAAFAEDLIDLELGPVAPDLRDRTRDWVVARILGAGDVTRTGLGLVATVLASVLRLRTGRAYAQLEPERRKTLAAGLARTKLPLASEFVRAVRSLAVTYVYEDRIGAAP